MSWYDWISLALLTLLFLLQGAENYRLKKRATKWESDVIEDIRTLSARTKELYRNHDKITEWINEDRNKKLFEDSEPGIWQ